MHDIYSLLITYSQYIKFIPYCSLYWCKISFSVDVSFCWCLKSNVQRSITFEIYYRCPDFCIDFILGHRIFFFCQHTFMVIDQYFKLFSLLKIKNFIKVICIDYKYSYECDCTSDVTDSLIVLILKWNPYVFANNFAYLYYVRNLFQSLLILDQYWLYFQNIVIFNFFLN
jgi:hypothetical protein